MNQKISIIIPTYNRAEKLEKCLFSLYKNDIANHEIIIVDDGGKMNAKEIIKKFKKVRYYKIKHGNSAKARNFGVRKARFDTLVFLEDDFILPNNLIKELIKLKKLNPIVLCKVNYNGKNIYSLAYQGIYDSFIYGNIFLENKNNFMNRSKYLLNRKNFNQKLTSVSLPLSCFLIPKKFFREIGGFNEKFSRLGDIEFVERLTNKNYKILFTDRVNIQHDSKENLKEFIFSQKGNASFDYVKYKYISFKKIIKIGLGKVFDFLSWIKESKGIDKIKLLHLYIITLSLYEFYFLKYLLYDRFHIKNKLK